MFWTCLWWGSWHATPKYGIWHIEYFKLKESEKMAEAGKSPWPPPPLPVFPDKGHKTVLLEVPSLHSRSGASLSLKTKGHQEESGQTGLAKFSPVYYNYLILNLLYSFTTVPSSSNLAKKYRGLFLWVFIFLWRFLWHTKLNLYAFLLFFCFYQFTSETSPGTLRALRETFSSHIPPIY